MRLQGFKTKHALLLALLVSLLLILRQYTDYVINNYGYEFSWFAVSVKILINYLLWASFYRLLLKVARKLLSQPFSFRILCYHLIIGVGIALIHRFLALRIYDFAYFAYSGFLRDWFTPGNQVALGAGLFSSFLEYWLIMTILLAVTYYSRYMQQQKELNEAKLNALQMQLQPHFLFNTLNSITSLIDIDGKKAQKMLSQLGFLLREILAHDQRHMIALSEELKYIEAYLAIEQIRFQDRMKIHLKVEENVLQATIPALLLQPLVENAIKHGISKSTEGGVIEIAAKSENGILIINICNDYPMTRSNKVNGFGIGIKNISNRLEQLYGEQHTFTQKMSDSKYITQITLPHESI